MKNIVKIALGGLLSILTMYLWGPAEVVASTERIEAVGIYTVGDGEDESPKEAKKRAREEAMRKAADKAGVYVESYSEMKNFRLTRDEINSIAGDVVRVESEAYSLKSLDQHILEYTARIVVLVDTETIAAKVQALKDSGQKKTQEYEALKKENARLRAEYDNLKSQNNKEGITQANEYFDRGNELMEKKDYQGAIREYSQALELASDYIDACYARGKAYQTIGQYEKALDDYTQLILLTNESANAFYLRGTVYEKMGRKENAIKDYQAAIQRDPKDKRVKKALDRLCARGRGSE